MAVTTDVLVIGGGPAGVSAALYARRSGLDVTILTKGKETGSLAKAHLIENYYGFAEPISGAELEARGIAGAKRLGVNVENAEVMSLLFKDTMDGFRVETGGETYEAPAVVLAAGAVHQAPPIQGLREREGRGVSYCAICDSFFYRKKTVAVLGSGAYALHEADILNQPAEKVLILTDGKEPEVDFPEHYAVYTAKVKAVEGEGKVERVVLADGTALDIAGSFVALGTAGSSDLARKIGALLNGTSVQVDENMATNVPGLFAAGDCTGGLLQVNKSAYEGAKAGLAASKYVRQQRAKAK